MDNPKQTIQVAVDRLTSVLTLEGYYQIDFYTGDITINGVFLPHGLCACQKYDQTQNDYDGFDIEWDNLSQATQREVLFEIGDRYCSNIVSKTEAEVIDENLTAEALQLEAFLDAGRVKEEIYNFVSKHEQIVSNDMKKVDENINVSFTKHGNRAACKALYEVISVLHDDTKSSVRQMMVNKRVNR